MPAPIAWRHEAGGQASLRVRTHTRIAFLTGRNVHSAYTERLDGFKAGMAELGLRDDIVITIPSTQSGASEAARTVIGLTERSTTVNLRRGSAPIGAEVSVPSPCKSVTCRTCMRIYGVIARSAFTHRLKSAQCLPPPFIDQARGDIELARCLGHYRPRRKCRLKDPPPFVVTPPGAARDRSSPSSVPCCAATCALSPSQRAQHRQLHLAGKAAVTRGIPLIQWLVR